ncbi:hypothetical protein I5O09_05830 [Pseudomonas parafulva]|uniref:hypothetical protein n=1 Tax=Pseudomonas parafulva TaxID=157782 RepID=UPI0018DA1A31|nr:hypothetical protein [Pseudomonas parafulva]MBH3343256.1 hypothetical protein [Pseudomonas parafulva]
MSEFKKYSRLLLGSAVPDIASAARYKAERAVDRLKDVQASMISADVESGSFTLRILDRKAFGDHIAGEASRFWLASMFSFVRASQREEKAASWQVVELYYAAYYAVHFAIRVTGVSISQLDSAAVTVISRSNLTGSPFAPTASLYKLNYKDLDNVVFTPVSQRGGSHKTAWESWGEIVSEFIRGTAQDGAEYISQSISLIEHQQTFLSGSNSSPADIRAEINYNFKGQLWAFEDRPKRHIEKINSMFLDGHFSGLGKSTRPEKLIVAAKYIVYLAYALLESVVARYPKSILNKYHQKHLTDYSHILDHLRAR